MQTGLFPYHVAAREGIPELLDVFLRGAIEYINMPTGENTNRTTVSIIIILKAQYHHWLLLYSFLNCFKENKTMLILAVEANSVPCVDMLLRKGANVNQKTNVSHESSNIYLTSLLCDYHTLDQRYRFTYCG
jgi:hypothetical protein